MKYVDNKNQNKWRNDIQTPEYLAKEIVEYYNPSGSILEPCVGEGNFIKYFPGDRICFCDIFIPQSSFVNKVNERFEIIKKDNWDCIDFLQYKGFKLEYNDYKMKQHVYRDEIDGILKKYPFDWIITNPPYNLFKEFLEKSCQISNNIVFLAPLNKMLGLKSTYKILEKYNFGIKSIKIWNTPKEFPQSGFSLGTVHFKYYESGCVDFYKTT